MIGNHQGKPFLKWVGGKSQQLNYIERKMPDLKGYTYIEPFVGGGAVLWHVLNTFPPKRIIINDLNPTLIAAYKIVRDRTDDLIEELKKIRETYAYCQCLEEKKEYYLHNRERFNNDARLCEVDKTALFIFLNKTSYNGLFRVNSKGAFNAPFGQYINPLICDEVVLRNDAKLLKYNNIQIIQGDFSQTSQYVDENTFVYLDPPYKAISKTARFTAYNTTGFDDEEHRRLKNFCDEINHRHGCFLLSNSDTMQCSPPDPFFDDLYSEYHIERVEAPRRINCKGDGRGKITEILVTNVDK